MRGDIKAAKELVKTTRDLPIYYSNGIAPWVGEDIGLFTRLNVEGKLWPILTGGSITHIFLGEENPDPKGLADFGIQLAKNSNIGYFSFTKDYTVCLACGHQMQGIKDVCSVCGSSEVEVYSRVTGYISPVSHWNNAKKQELKDRVRSVII
jgi:ribonucleoside-triphosphate reductase